MPQISLRYTTNLEACFDARRLALDLHRAAVDIVGADLRSCKTRLNPILDWAIGNGTDDHAMLHVDFRILSGRPSDARKELGRRVLELATTHLRSLPATLEVQVTVEVAEMDRDYFHKAIISGEKARAR